MLTSFPVPSTIRIPSALALLLFAPGLSSAEQVCGPEKLRALTSPVPTELRPLGKGRNGPLLDVSFRADLAYADWLDARMALKNRKDWEARLKAGDPEIVSLKSIVDKTEARYTQIQRRRHEMLQFIRHADPIPNAALLKQLGDAILEKREQIRNVRLDELKFIALSDFLDGPERTLAAQKLREVTDHLQKLRKEMAELRNRYTVEDERYEFITEYPKQLTGRQNVPGEAPRRYETPDGVFFFRKDGRVNLYGSGNRYYEYPSIGAAIRGEEGRFREMTLTHPDGTPFDESTYHSHEASWDNVVYEAKLGFYKVDPDRMPPSKDPRRLIAYNPDNGTYEFMHMGSMSPSRFRAGGRPTDPGNTNIRENWTRRRFAAEKVVRIADPDTGVERNWPSFDHFVMDYLSRNANPNYDKLMNAKGKIVWERRRKDLLGREVPSKEDWDSHGYGSELLLTPEYGVMLDEANRGRIRFESVIGSGPGKKKLGHTKIFEVAMQSHYQADLSTGAPKVIIDSFNPETGKPFAATRRSFDPTLSLVEGPITSPQWVEPKHILNRATANIGDNTVYQVTGFAADDYATDRYKLALAYIKTMKGRVPPVGTPMIPVTQKGANGEMDLKDFGVALRKLFGISWGPSRPFIFKINRKGKDRWFCLFHGVDETITPAGIDPRRNPSPTEIDLMFRNEYLKEFWWYKDPNSDQLFMVFFK